jgi:hypothetical protein
MGKRILAMRHDHQERWIARPKTGWTDDEWVFMHDLMTLVCMGPSLPVESFELVCARIDWVGAGYRREEKMLVALSEKAAREALKSLFLELNDVSSDAADIRVRHAGGEIFRAARNLEHWDIFLDDYELVPTS